REVDFRWEAPPLRERLAVVLPSVAWAALFIAMLAALIRSRTHFNQQEIAIGAGLFAAALAARLALPWGPVEFAEPERVAAVWSSLPLEPPPAALATLLVGLRRLGLPPGALLHLAG